MTQKRQKTINVVACDIMQCVITERHPLIKNQVTGGAWGMSKSIQENVHTRKCMTHE